MEVNATNLGIIAGATTVVIIFLICFWWWTGRDDEEEVEDDVEQQRPGLHMVEEASSVGIWQQSSSGIPEQKHLMPSGAKTQQDYQEDFPGSPLKYQYHNLRRVSIPKARRINLKIGPIPE